MCPDPQLLSIYMDGELPSPWKEKLETHLAQCSGCREKYEKYLNLRKLIAADANSEFINDEQTSDSSGIQVTSSVKDRVWQNMASRRNFKPHSGIWYRRLSIPLPAAAAAAIILAFLAVFLFRGNQTNQLNEPSVKANIILAAEEEIPGIIPAADMSGVLQYLGADGADILILRLPESRNFLRSGDPAIIRAADYSPNMQVPQQGSRRHQ